MAMPRCWNSTRLRGVRETTADWTTIRAIFNHHGLQVIGVCGSRRCFTRVGGRCWSAEPGRFQAHAKSHFPIDHRAGPGSPAAGGSAGGSCPGPPTPPPPVSHPTLIIDRPLRSGQQAYARGGDLVVLAAVNAGAEVIADGSIHIYAPLRGRGAGRRQRRGRRTHLHHPL